jgi:hypothetical protein
MTDTRRIPPQPTDDEPDDDGTLNGSVERRPWERRQLCRELATGDMTRAALARKYGVVRSTITEFAKRHAREIDEIKAHLDDDFAGLWIADKSARMAAYQADLELSGTGKYGSHWEQIRTRSQILKQVAEELGQMPPRAGVVVVPVTHIIEGVDVESLK